MLTDIAVKAAKPTDKLKKLSDSGGLQLWIEPDGAKRWRIAYRFAGKQRVLAAGVYPAVGLKDARERRDEAKRLLAAGVDPSLAKKTAKKEKAISAVNTFEVIGKEVAGKKRREGRALATLEKFEWLMQLAQEGLGARPIAEIKAPEVLQVLRSVEARGRHETAKKLRAAIGEVFRYAVATGIAEADPTGPLKGALIAPTTKNRAAIVEPKALGGLLRAIRAYEGAPETRFALELQALTFVRPGELRAAEWSEFDLDAGVWSIPAEKTKMRRPHRVPIVQQTGELLNELRSLTGRGKFLFPSIRTPLRCMSENTVNAALRRLGYSKDVMVGHGFRSTASSLLNECGLWNPDAIERQLAHVDEDSIRRAYARADFWDERVKMMSWWADRLDQMRDGASIIQLKAAAEAQINATGAR